MCWEKIYEERFTRVPYLSHGDTFLPELFNGPGRLADIGVNNVDLPLPKVPNERLLSAAWLNQTTAVYFEPEFISWGLGAGCGYMARALLAAWIECHHISGETPNFQQMRYLATPVRLPGPAYRPIRDVVCTYKIICEAA